MPKDANTPPKTDETQTGQMVLPVMTNEAKKRLNELIPETKRIEQRRLADTKTEAANRKEINKIMKQFGLENYKIETQTIVKEFGEPLVAFTATTTKIKIATGEPPEADEEFDDSGDDE